MNTSLNGQSPDRIDGRLKVTGAALYSGDHNLPNLAYGYLLLSDFSRGRLQSVDFGGADSAPGVIAIFTPFHTLKLYSPLDRTEGVNSGDVIPLLQDPEVRYFGQIIGLVVAESFEQARDAAMLIRFKSNQQAATIRFEDGMQKAYQPHSVGDIPATDMVLAPGVDSIDSVIALAPVSITATYESPIEHHNPMEPHATVAVWNNDRLTIYDATQWVDGQQRNLAAVLGVEPENVRVICPFVGGAFGCKGSMWMHSPLTAAAAREIQRPVKTILSRPQMFTSVGHRPMVRQELTLAATTDGQFQAIKHEVFSTTSETKVFVEAAAHRTSRVLYKSPNILVRHTLVPLDIAPGTFMRAPGVTPGMYGLECALDELAIKLKMDPVELRLRNYSDFYPGSSLPWSSKHLRECYQLGAEKFKWSNRSVEPRSVRDEDWLVGTGMATALYPAHRSPAGARVRFQADGTVGVVSGTHDLGTGMYTVMAVVAAETLGVPIERIRPILGDSAFPDAPAAGGSQSTASVAPAVQAAAKSAIKKLIALATREKNSPFFGRQESALTYAGGELKDGKQTVPFDQLLVRVNRASVDALERSAPGDEEEHYSFSSFGAQFCELRVNEETGEIRVSRFNSVIDAGRIVSGKTGHSQIMGGVVFGIGMALLEATDYEPETGWIANRNVAEYLMPVNADVPVIDVDFVEYPDTIFNPLGARGIGEIGVTGVAAAIANAVYNATGKRVRKLPISPEAMLA
ncbi:MAG: xanthine dehydrogenase family protein molybdopterin-binding subunit [Verrucomicrobia bacterium]|nr:xanthine dehydrogenase family protein molybdopterin-binding subunit [Verrucomicrobiota bacterium]